VIHLSQRGVLLLIFAVLLGVAAVVVEFAMIRHESEWLGEKLEDEGGRQRDNRITFADNELDLVASVVYAEARAEPYAGQVAVAAVVFNRVQHPGFPSTVPGVIYEPGAFTAVRDGQINLKPDGTAYRAVRAAVNGVDPSGGALYYFNPSRATDPWIRSRQRLTTIGNHVFAL